MKTLLGFWVVVSTSAMAADSALLQWAKEKTYSQPYAALAEHVRPEFRLRASLIEDLRNAGKENPKQAFDLEVKTKEGAVTIEYPGIENYVLGTLASAEREARGQEAVPTSRGKITFVHAKESRNQRMAAISVIVTQGLKADEMAFLYMGQRHAYDVYALDPSLPAVYLSAKAFKDGFHGNDDLRYVCKTLGERRIPIAIQDVYPQASSNEQQAIHPIEMQGMLWAIGYHFYYNPTFEPSDFDLNGKRMSGEPKAVVLGVAHGTRDESLLQALPSTEVLKASGKKRLVVLLEDFAFRNGKPYTDDELAAWYRDTQCKPISDMIRNQLELYRKKTHPNQKLVLTEAQIQRLNAIAAADSACLAIDNDKFIEKMKAYRKSGIDVVFNGLELLSNDPLVKLTDPVAAVYRMKTHYDVTLRRTGKPPATVSEADIRSYLKKLEERVFTTVKAY